RTRLNERVEAPAAVNHANLKEHAVVAVRAGRGFLFQMEPALFGVPSIRTEDSFPGERLGAGERVDIDEEAIVHTVELDGLTAWRVDDAWMSDHCRWMTADLIE